MVIKIFTVIPSQHTNNIFTRKTTLRMRKNQLYKQTRNMLCVYSDVHSDAVFILSGELKMKQGDE